MRILLLTIFLLIISCAETHEVTKKPSEVQKTEVTKTDTAVFEEAIPEKEEVIPQEDSTVSEVSFFAIGDVLFHTPLFKACKEDESKCNFDYIFAPWKEEIQKADIAAVNQETIFVPREDGYASYPSFGSPEEVGIAEIAAGFDIITHATNHTIDRKASAVDYTIDFWTGKSAKALGIHKTQSSQDSVYTLDKNGIRFAFVNFTYGLNGQKLPNDRPYLVDLLDSSGHWVEMVRKAEASAEVTVAFMHFGTE
ncbi:MAG: CapA family protein [Fibrobacter sp.]|nr:CapA family protein [Fibrobacter sp.]